MPSISEIYELLFQLGDKQQAVCTIRLPCPRFSSYSVGVWAQQLQHHSGTGGVRFSVKLLSMNIEKKHIDARLQVHRW